MIENPQTRKDLLGLLSKNNTVKFGKDVTELLHKGKTPYVAHERLLVYGDPPFTATDNVGLIDIDVGTAVNLEERGIICTNPSGMHTDYYSKKGKLSEKNWGIKNYRSSLMAVQMDGLGRALDSLSRRLPTFGVLMATFDAWVENGTFDIYRGSILEEGHQIQEQSLENLTNKSTLMKLRKASEKYRPLLESVAAER